MRVSIDDWIHGTSDEHYRFRVVATDKEGNIVERVNTNRYIVVFLFWFKHIFKSAEDNK